MYTTPISILLVDDDSDTQQIVTMIISHFKYALTIAQTAQSALDQLSTSTPDIVMLDIQLPDINGFVALNAIRDASIKHPIKVIAITAYFSPDTAANILDYGFDGYLEKPITAAKLIPYLQNLMTNS